MSNSIFFNPKRTIAKAIALAVVIAFSAQACLQAAPAQRMNSALRPVSDREKRTIPISVVRSVKHSGPVKTGVIPIYSAPKQYVEAATQRVVIGQRQGVFTEHAVATLVGPCVYLCVINEDTGKQFAAHVDGKTLLFEDRSIINELFGWKNKKAVIAGGKGVVSEPDVQNILEFLYYVEILTENIRQFELLETTFETVSGVMSIPIRTTENKYDLLMRKDIAINSKEFPLIDTSVFKRRTPLVMVQGFPGPINGLKRGGTGDGPIFDAAAARPSQQGATDALAVQRGRSTAL